MWGSGEVALPSLFSKNNCYRRRGNLYSNDWMTALNLPLLVFLVTLQPEPGQNADLGRQTFARYIPLLIHITSKIWFRISRLLMEYIVSLCCKSFIYTKLSFWYKESAELFIHVRQQWSESRSWIICCMLKGKKLTDRTWFFSWHSVHSARFR